MSHQLVHLAGAGWAEEQWGQDQQQWVRVQEDKPAQNTHGKSSLHYKRIDLEVLILMFIVSSFQDKPPEHRGVHQPLYPRPPAVLGSKIREALKCFKICLFLINPILWEHQFLFKSSQVKDLYAIIEKKTFLILVEKLNLTLSPLI